MPNRRPIKLAVVLILLIALIATTFFLVLYRSSRKRTFLLSDGSSVTLVGETYGTHHVLKVRGKSIWQMFRSPVAVASTDTGADTLVLWIAHHYEKTHAAASAPIWPPVTAPSWWDWAEVSDGDGSEVVTSNPSPSGPYELKSNEAITSVYELQGFDGEALEIPIFPRRTDSLTIKFHRSSVTEPVAEFTVPNPKHGDYPHWAVDSLPASRSDNGVQTTLVHVGTAPYQTVLAGARIFASEPLTELKHKVLPGEALAGKAEFSTVEGGRTVTNWKPVGSSFIDATGNTFTSEISSSYDSKGLQCIDFLTPFCTNEPQKMRVEFVQDESTIFPPDDVWTIPILPLPPNGKFVEQSASTARVGAHVRLVGVGSPGTITWGRSAWEYMSTPFYFVRVAYTPISSGAHIVLHAEDQSGRPVERVPDDSDHGYWIKPSEWDYGAGQSVTISLRPGSQSTTDATGDEVFRTFFFKPRPGMTRVKLVFAVHKSRFVDFNVDLDHAISAQKP